jgi:hypothetical protein
MGARSCAVISARVMGHEVSACALLETARQATRATSKAQEKRAAGFMSVEWLATIWRCCAQRRSSRRDGCYRASSSNTVGMLLKSRLIDAGCASGYMLLGWPSSDVHLAWQVSTYRNDLGPLPMHGCQPPAACTEATIVPRSRVTWK